MQEKLAKLISEMKDTGCSIFSEDSTKWPRAARHLIDFNPTLM